MQDISPSLLMEMTLGLASGSNEHDRFNRLIDTIRKIITCDCAVLLQLQGDTLVPVAMQGLTRDTLGRRFVIAEHPRFAQICQARSPVIFESDSELPDPFDGLLIDHDGDLPMHSCMGFPLYFGEKLLGVLTLDSLMPDIFSQIPARNLDVLSAIAASNMQMADTFAQLKHQAKQSKRLLDELNEEAWERDGGELIGDSASMLALKSDIEVVAPSEFNILIHGDTGVGKELVARTLHHQSQRRTKPLVYVNCAAIPENLVESELFGHVRGAFTGADKNRLGKFALADEGTLFLDEIGELPLAAQSKLLRALQNNEIQPVGQDNIQMINVRVLAATNRDLKQEVEAGRFRSDLYHRLSVYPIAVPALKDRDDDISVLAGFFLEQARRKLGIKQVKFHSQVLVYLNHYDWPGNVRELEHVVSRSALKALARSSNKTLVTIIQEDCGLLDQNMSTASPDEMNAPRTIPHFDSAQGLRLATDEFQRQMIIGAIENADFNWTQAGKTLQMDRANLIRLAKRLGLSISKEHRIERL